MSPILEHPLSLHPQSPLSCDDGTLALIQLSIHITLKMSTFFKCVWFYHLSLFIWSLNSLSTSIFPPLLTSAVGRGPAILPNSATFLELKESPVTQLLNRCRNNIKWKDMHGSRRRHVCGLAIFILGPLLPARRLGPCGPHKHLHAGTLSVYQTYSLCSCQHNTALC